jgi:hypothetical protein
MIVVYYASLILLLLTLKILGCFKTMTNDFGVEILHFSATIVFFYVSKQRTVCSFIYSFNCLYWIAACSRVQSE